MQKFNVILGLCTALALAGCGSDGGDGGGNTGGDNNMNNGGGINLLDGGDDNNGNGDTNGNGNGNEEPVWPVGCEARATGVIAGIGASDVCGAGTRACLTGCASATTQQEYQACINGCFTNDDGTPFAVQGQQVTCDICVSYQQFDCLHANGCADAIEDFSCCIEANYQTCAAQGAGAQNCIAQACGQYQTAVGTCAQTTPSTQVCNDWSNAAYDQCFP